ncbi:unnamed protein product [Penicillium camemberti]|uniref:Str. FM013 n=1 Tax=Penicillium camemberti (strain FM 013) TaxID=1429867 RepID=A0A0G4PHD9_PENC3|nr:unnamed protein product [Penicillium camemberti]
MMHGLYISRMQGRSHSFVSLRVRAFLYEQPSHSRAFRLCPPHSLWRQHNPCF